MNGIRKQIQKGAIGCLALAILMSAMGFFWLRDALNKSRRTARESRALEIGHELRNTTNSMSLDGNTPQFTADVANLLSKGGTWSTIDRSGPREPWAVVRLLLTNNQGDALLIRLKNEYPSGRMQLLDYRKIAAPESSSNAIPR